MSALQTKIRPTRLTFPAEATALGNARKRCTDPNNLTYRYYGGRGIECRFSSLQEFIDAVGPRPTPAHTLDRIDVEGHYEPGNVRWATRTEQSRNRTDGRWITTQGKTLLVCEWSELLGVGKQVLYHRTSRGWCDDCIISPQTRRGRSHCPHISSKLPDEAIELLEENGYNAQLAKV
jgi:hypothetical protein